MSTIRSNAVGRLIGHRYTHVGMYMTCVSYMSQVCTSGCMGFCLRGAKSLGISGLGHWIRGFA